MNENCNDEYQEFIVYLIVINIKTKGFIYYSQNTILTIQCVLIIVVQA